jgi:hypothetical protein
MRQWLARAGVMAGLWAGLWSGPVGAAPREPLEKVAVIPVSIVNADKGNGDVMTRAIAANLKHHGCTLVEDATVRAALSELRIPLERPIFIQAMTRVGQRVKADFVVYTRALVEGPTVHDDMLNRGRPALILHVMIADARTGDLLMSNEIFQEWLAPDPGAREQTVTDAAAAEAAQRLLSKLYMPTAVSGQLMDAESGRPLVEVEAFLQQEGAPTRVALTDERGEFSFKDLARTSYTITTHAPGYYDVVRVVPFALGEKRLTLSLAPHAAAVSGVLRDAKGNPLAGLPVQLRGGDGKLVDTLTTLADGSFGRPGLKVGTYTLVVTLPGGGRLERTIELRAGDLGMVELKAP